MPKGHALGDELTRQIFFFMSKTSPVDKNYRQLANMVNSLCLTHGHPGLSFLGIRDLCYQFIRWNVVLQTEHKTSLVYEWKRIFERYYMDLKEERKKKYT